MKKYMLFLALTLAFSIGLQMLLGRLGVHPIISLGIIIGCFIAFPFILRRRYMSRMQGYGGDSETRGGGFFGMGSQEGSGKVKYICLVCNNKHKGGTCPRCGSKMQRADF